jgi:hypothetical protein
MIRHVRKGPPGWVRTTLLLLLLVLQTTAFVLGLILDDYRWAFYVLVGAYSLDGYLFRPKRRTTRRTASAQTQSTHSPTARS